MKLLIVVSAVWVVVAFLTGWALGVFFHQQNRDEPQPPRGGSTHK